ncbi:MAG: (d)CMP kinase [Rhizomicrobium sp.]
MTKPVVIAVDGTAASGKGTLAKRLARHFGFAHLDSGSLYRLTALGVIRASGDPGNETDAVAAAGRIDPSQSDSPDIRQARVAEAASVVAAIPAVRARLIEFQRGFAANPPGGAKGVVIDGRDIGTIVCPKATAKLYVDAKPEARAHRRWMELTSLGQTADEAAVLVDIHTRDARDSGRAVAPLKPAQDADLLDTTNLDIDSAFAVALALVKPKVEEALEARPRG